MIEAALRATRDNEFCDKLNGIVERLGRNVDHILHSQAPTRSWRCGTRTPQVVLVLMVVASHHTGSRSVRK